MKPFGCTTFLKASMLILIVFPSCAVATEKKADKAISRSEPNIGVSFVNFKEDKFSYLNITILGYSHVDWMPQCSFACLETPTCFSYNLAAYPSINGKLLCELLPSDKYNNSDKFMSSESFHHFSIASTCSGWPCKNNGTWLPLYEENSYKCVCKAGFTGRDCETDNDECWSENECHVNATCTNTIGSYNCTCKKGYGGDGKSCADLDECSSENKCHVNATCTNTLGSYNCTCKKGYGGDGRNCSEKIAKGLENSVIIGSNPTHLVQLSEWLKPVSQSNSQWKLCWRGLRDGWASSTFHSLCDGKGPTVTIIKVNQNIFGGYASVSWEPENCGVKTAEGICCHFPFIYNGKVYKNCTTKDNGNITWCSTTANYDQDFLWGNCLPKPENCGVKTTGGICCHFPFIYHGKVYKNCTTKDNGNTPWCSTTANYDQDGQYGNCLQNNLYWKNDRNAFLFSLANQINTPQRLNQKDPNNPYSLYSADFYCPTFGLGHDLHVANNATGHTGSYTNINSYHKPTGTSSYNTFLAGQQHFDPSEIETFYEAI